MADGATPQDLFILSGCHKTVRTCKLFISVSTTTKLGDEFATGLKDEDGAGLVVHHNHMSVVIHRDSLGTH